jgi:hypothetical protein
LSIHLEKGGALMTVTKTATALPVLSITKAG